MYLCHKKHRQRDTFSSLIAVAIPATLQTAALFFPGLSAARTRLGFISEALGGKELLLKSAESETCAALRMLLYQRILARLSCFVKSSVGSIMNFVENRRSNTSLEVGHALKRRKVAGDGMLDATR